jgi:purine-binding chemotaxis protein CheW
MSNVEAIQPVSTGAEQSQYLTFLLGGELFAIGILAVKEIIEYGQLTSVPMMPACIRGVINLRGAVVPVIDLSARFGREPTALTRRTCIVIAEVQVEQERLTVGVIVDAVNEVLDITPADIEPAPSFGARLRTDFITGMGKVGSKFVVILNVDRVLSLEDLAALVNAQMAEAA